MKFYYQLLSKQHRLIYPVADFSDITKFLPLLKVQPFSCTISKDHFSSLFSRKQPIPNIFRVQIRDVFYSVFSEEIPHRYSNSSAYSLYCGSSLTNTLLKSFFGI